MKKTLLLLAIIFIVFFNACKKGAVNTTADAPATTAEFVITAQNTLNVESVKSLPNQDLKKVAYGLLKPIEKYLLWLDNIRTVSADFTPQQKTLTMELIAGLTPKIFSGGETASLTAFRDKWLAKASVVFTKKEIRTLAYQIFSTTDATTQLAVNIYDDINLITCNCNGGATLTCDGESFCPTDTVNGRCKDPTEWGCGFFWGSACNNKCFTPRLEYQ